MLENESWVSEVREAGSVDGALREAVVGRISLVAMDLTLPDGDGLDATSRILRTCPDSKILIFTWMDDESLVARALRAGARGYVLKETDPDAIVNALKSVADGGVVLGPRIGPTLLAGGLGVRTLPPPFDRLTARECEILAYVAAGESNATIAWHLGLCDKTVRNHLSAIFVKIGAANRNQAARRVRDAGVTLVAPHNRDSFTRCDGGERKTGA